MIGKSIGIALSATGLVVKDDPTWELSEMGFAQRRPTVTAGIFTRVFSVVKLEGAIAPVLKACGDHW
jgi:hypothetical protein